MLIELPLTILFFSTHFMAPLKGVWGTPGGPASASLSDWLVTKFTAIGLDGSICAEYILSLVELYSGSAAERSAAVTEFLTDSVGSSNIRTEQQRMKFVQDTVDQLNSKLFGSSIGVGPLSTGLPVRAPSAPSAPQSVAAPPVNNKKGFKKGIKLTGTALKEGVGNVKSSYVQKYSDDEREPEPARPVYGLSSVGARPPPVRMQSSDRMEFPTLSHGSSAVSASEGFYASAPTPVGSTPHTPAPSAKQTSTVHRSKKNKAREIGPDEDWDETPPASWKTPMDRRDLTIMMTPMESPTTTVRKDRTAKQLTMSTLSVTQIVPSPQRETRPVSPILIAPIAGKTPVVSPPPKPPAVSILSESVLIDEAAVSTAPPSAVTSADAVLSSLDSLHLPADILSFDFKFEGDDDEEEEGVVPMMTGHRDVQSMDEAPVTGEPFDLLRQMFSGGFMTPPGLAPVEPVRADVSTRTYPVKYMLDVLSAMKRDRPVDVPKELQSLVYQPVVEVAAAAAPAKLKPAESTWRTVGAPVAEATTQPAAWRASGYKDRWTGAKQAREVASNEEGFW